MMYSFLFQSTLPTRGSDIKDGKSSKLKRAISIHAPHEGERLAVRIMSLLLATISIHAPHEGERQGNHFVVYNFFGISIHAPHEGERRPYAHIKRTA